MQLVSFIGPLNKLVEFIEDEKISTDVKSIMSQMMELSITTDVSIWNGIDDIDSHIRRLSRLMSTLKAIKAPPKIIRSVTNLMIKLITDYE